MSEISCEYVVHKENTAKDRILTALKCVGVLVAGVALLMGPILFGVTSLLGVGVIALGAAIWGCTKFITRSRIDYEYSFSDTSSELNIDKIINLSDRKVMAVVPAKEITSAGEYDPEHFEEKDVKVRDFCGSTNPKDPVYFVYTQGGRKECVVVERDEKVFGAVKRAMPVSVYRDGFLRRK